MRVILIASTVSLSCATVSAPEDTIPQHVSEDRIAQLEARLAEQNQELEETRSQLALVRVESSESQPLRETVRISPREDDDLQYFEDDGSGWDEPSQRLPEPEASSAPRPVLRLYGPSRGDLPVVPLRDVSLPSATSPYPSLGQSPIWTNHEPPPARRVIRTESPEDSAMLIYRDALGHLRARRFVQAMAKLDQLLSRHTSHPIAANGRYWRAEVLYIERRYGEALHAFQAYIQEHVEAERVPDALYKIVLCHRRMGDEVSAQRVLSRLRQEYPNSVAARSASWEDA